MKTYLKRQMVPNTITLIEQCHETEITLGQQNSPLGRARITFPHLVYEFEMGAPHYSFSYFEHSSQVEIHRLIEI
mgnify:CR=1 FL=1